MTARNREPAEDLSERESREIVTRPAEQLLIDALGNLQPQPTRILSTSLGLAQAAIAAAGQFPKASVCSHYLDLYRAELARTFLAAQSPSLDNLLIDCSADFPAAEIDLALIPISAQGEAELTRDQLQAARQLLAPYGFLLAATDNPRDRWLHEELEKLFPSVRRTDSATGVLYTAQNTAPLKRVRNFTAEFVVRDGDRLLQIQSRPGVFSHRKIDAGARQLLNAMQIGPGDRVLDLGCGSGVVAIAAAAREKSAQVHAVDSHARAVECTVRGAKLNDLMNITVELSSTGPSQDKGPFDLVLANPPYYAGLRIAQFFVETARAVLKPGGKLLVVHKHPAWYEEHLPELFSAVEIIPSKDYYVALCRR